MVSIKSLFMRYIRTMMIVCCDHADAAVDNVGSVGAKKESWNNSISYFTNYWLKLKFVTPVNVDSISENSSDSTSSSLRSSTI